MQVPVEHVAPLALAGLQDVPQRPQLERVVREDSQPSAEPPLQSPQPPSQVPSVQVPDEQLSLAWARSQVRPHEPQLDSEVSEVSQPSVQPPLQLP